jgi:hypothetical protein
MFAELRFRHESMKVKSPTEARGWASTKLTSLPRIFFNRDARGGQIFAASPFTIRPDRGGVSIEAVGRDAAMHLLKIAGGVQAEFLSAVPGGESLLRTGHYSLSTRPFLMSWAVHDLIIQKSHARSSLLEQWKANPNYDFTETAAKVFKDKLAERCSLTGIEMPDDAIFGDFRAKVVRPVLAGGAPKFTVALEFRSNVFFEGPWYIGKLANKSCGRVVAHREAARAREAAA